MISGGVIGLSGNASATLLDVANVTLALDLQVHLNAVDPGIAGNIAVTGDIDLGPVKVTGEAQLRFNSRRTETIGIEGQTFFLRVSGANGGVDPLLEVVGLKSMAAQNSTSAPEDLILRSRPRWICGSSN